jgi:hypothetical protein
MKTNPFKFGTVVDGSFSYLSCSLSFMDLIISTASKSLPNSLLPEEIREWYSGRKSEGASANDHRMTA